MSDSTFTLKMTKTGPFEFRTTFDKDYPDLFFDEPEGVGGNDQYPNASRIMAAAVANCLSASLTACFNKSRMPMEDFGLETEVTTTIGRNEEGRLRIQKMDAKLYPSFGQELDEKTMKRFERCVGIFKNYCTVSMSVKDGFDVEATVDLQ